MDYVLELSRLVPAHLYHPIIQDHTNVAQYPLNHMAHAPVMFELAATNSLRGDTFTRKNIFFLSLTLASRSYQVLPNTLNNMWFMYLQSLNCYDQQFRTRYNNRKPDEQTYRCTDEQVDGQTDDTSTAVRNKCTPLLFKKAGITNSPPPPPPNARFYTWSP